MALPSRSSATSDSYSRPTVLNNPTESFSSNQSSSSGSNFGGIEDPQALAALQLLIQQLQTGQTAGQKQNVERNNEITRVRELSRDYSKGAAFLDAENAVNQALRKSQEANMPAIVKSIQGAGTSASSMQGLLAQRLATESAQAAGALGAKQAVDYGNISANLAGVLEGLTRVNDVGTDNLIKALDLMKVQKGSQYSSSSGSQRSGGGGQRIAGSSDSSGSYSSSGDNQVSRLEGTGNSASYSSGNSGSYYGGGWGDYTDSSYGDYPSSSNYSDNGVGNWVDTGYDLGSGYASYGGGESYGDWVDTGYDLGSGYADYSSSDYGSSDYGYSDYGSFF